MDKDKLEDLRRRYSGNNREEIYTDKFKAMAANLLKDGVRTLPFSGHSRFLDAPLKEGLDDIDIALIGVPFDLGVTNRPGARFGPRAVRAMERIGPTNHQTGFAPLAAKRVADVGDVPITSQFNLEQGLEMIEAYFHNVIASGVRPLSVGGDHSISYPILKAVGKKEPVGLVHIDAHCDTGGPLNDTKFHHGGPFRHAVLDGDLDPDRTIQIGIRGAAEALWEFSYESGMTVIHIEDVMERGMDQIIAEARRVIGDGPTYISLDVDGLDPAFTPGTGTPEVGGLTPRETQKLLRGLEGLNIIGGDVVEVAPQYDPSTNTVQVAAQMLFEILCVMATNDR